MKVLFTITTGVADPTRASLPLHLAANGSIEIGDEPHVLLAGDGTEYLLGDALGSAQGLGVPPMRELVGILRDHEVPVYV